MDRSNNQSISISRCGGRETQTEKRGDGRLRREKGRTSAQRACSWIDGEYYCKGELNTRVEVWSEYRKVEDTTKKEIRKQKSESQNNRKGEVEARRA